MFKTVIINVVITLPLLFIAPNLSAAADYQSMSTKDLSAIRGTLYNASQEERNAFQMEWTSRMDQMTPAERQQYSGQGSGGAGLNDGSGLPGGSGVNSGRESAPGRRNDSGHGDGPGDGSGNGSKGGGNAGNGGGKGRQ